TQAGESFAVFLDMRRCPCGWDFRGVPCAHAVAAISLAGFNGIDFVSEYVTVSRLRKYIRQRKSRKVDVTVPEDSNLPKVGPPNTSRRPGRPNKKRTRTEDIGIPSK
ncbi:hypothetical protein V1509DRAFT_569393, partial [Lipomyces kononenkoae]